MYSIPYFLLIDLQTFPKGVVSLSLPLLAAYLEEVSRVSILDLNMNKDWERQFHDEVVIADFLGIKVSSQNFKQAVSITKKAKEINSKIQIVWGGEFPTLQPDFCIQYTDSIVTKRIEGCIDEFLSDVRQRKLKRHYKGANAFDRIDRTPSFSKVPHIDSYYNFMGWPLETSGGCDRFCNFCMVHTMQAKAQFKSLSLLEMELKNASGKFINVIDYNIGMSKQHLLQVCALFENSPISGWMAEMCLEQLEDEDILKALSKSRCRIIYCGLESISPNALKSINKNKTNDPDRYLKIIRKAQSFGIDIASGFILGLPDTDEETIEETIRFFIKAGIIYVKLTFLTYNPGTFYHKSMIKKGNFLTDDFSKYDGFHLTFLHHGQNAELFHKGLIRFENEFYSIKSILKRAWLSKKNWWHFLEFVLFNICYNHVYHSWVSEVKSGAKNDISKLVQKPFRKSLKVSIADRLIKFVRSMRVE